MNAEDRIRKYVNKFGIENYEVIVAPRIEAFQIENVKLTQNFLMKNSQGYH